jgi:predicted ribosomally synthesized peptide with nif11-like leader
MSIENARAFYQKMTTDEAFRTQLQNTPSEERTSFIKTAGYDFTPTEWETATASVLDAAQSNRELDETELEAIAGGRLPWIVPMYGLPPQLRWPY